MVELTTEKIDLESLLAAVEDVSTGAAVVFLGRVRNNLNGREVLQMDYEAYPQMALKKMHEIVKKTRDQWPDCKIAMVHRTGNLKLGEVSVAIAVATPHRQEAFAACRFAIDTLKETVPIWKKEYFSDGESWVEGVIPQITKDQERSS